MAADPNRRLLILKFGAIGDVVMAIPAAFAMHRRGYAVDWLCSETAAPILRLYPWINVLTLDEPKLLRGSKLQSLSAMLGLWRRFGGKRYDICATLYYDSRYKLLTLPIRARRKILLSRLDRSFALLPGRHHTDEYARVLLSQIGTDSGGPSSPTVSQSAKLGSQDAGAPNSDSEAQLPTSFANAETLFQLAPISAPNLPPNPHPRNARKPRIVIAPAGARNLMRDDALRRWPIENYVELAAAFLARGYEVILSGGPGDAWASPLFASLAIADLIGKLSLTETLALLDSADVTVTHDTGPLHLAGLTSTAIVTVFGPTDPHGRLPQRHNCVALWGGEGFACRPCYDGSGYAPCAHNGCMSQITPAMVFTEAETLLTAIREGRQLLPRIRVPRHTPIQIVTLSAPLRP